MEGAKEIKRVLCVGDNNTCRSPMFAALLKQGFELAGKKVEVESAGIAEKAAGGNPADNMTTMPMESAGLSLHQHRSRWIGDIDDLSPFDLILCMDQRIYETVGWRQSTCLETRIELADPLTGSIPSPARSQTAYNQCARTITATVQRLVGVMVPL